ncbi:hypothetical protein [Arthrobacter sp. NEB 688]|uniref:hypothetical protein n=1 Tax=Arthrobacter sp. NEB 688 TaxID=904039 RepID=UPI0015678FB0|nr:hypothetical protein [Arthrobacter sp. NEB 688]QKE83894.1 hypothetical protein HL663_08040 [Arthrobacter sp. NEB 688]
MGPSTALAIAVTSTAAVVAVAVGTTTPAVADGDGDHHTERAAEVRIVAPARQDVVGVAGRGWAVDLRVTVHGRDALARSGFSPQLTGPAAHASTAPFPGAFAPGADEALPGLVVLDSTTAIGAGAGQNLAGLFNLTALTDLRPDRVSVMDTWIVGAPSFGTSTRSTILAAVVDDLDQDGRYDDAPAVVPDADGDGDVDARDLRALGLASRVASVDFVVTGP